MRMNPSVYARSEKASFFLPSRYQRMGLPNTKDPVSAAEKMSIRSIMIGTNTVFGSSEPNNVDVLLINVAMSTT